MVKDGSRGCGRVDAVMAGAAGGQRQFLAPDALDLAYSSVGIEFGHGERRVAGLVDHQRLVKFEADPAPAQPGHGRSQLAKAGLLS